MEAGLHDEATNKFTLKSLDVPMDKNSTGYSGSTLKVEEATVKNATATENGLSDPKK